ncbi:hypothetical protein NDU88_000935 [Pleurodeles waltl]|uniref:Uncharacterized protein n=1 Tax=Pleurodeles waltl TaxID=8319 RepID=A0AAV7WKB9_PLEWA|nr:hypothetical protein NDU88_000935 [Pleurodeles waltl]
MASAPPEAFPPFPSAHDGVSRPLPQQEGPRASGSYGAGSRASTARSSAAAFVALKEAIKSHNGVHADAMSK